MTSPSAQLMDRIYRHQRYVYDFTRKPYLLGRDRLIAELQPPPGRTVLEIGCGTGRNLIQAARRYPDAQFFGIDVSAMMLATARQAVRRADLDHRIALAQADAAALVAGDLLGHRQFERVFISYALSMIPAWRQLLGAAADMLAPGGSLHVVDFGDQRDLPGWFHALLFAWLAKFHVSPRTGLELEVAAVAAQRAMAYRFTRLYRGYAFHAIMARRPSGFSLG